jgi:Maltose-binding periplasmic proteins/domains
MFKRTLKFLLPLAILCATILSACGGSTGSTSTTPSNAPITITIWHGWQGDFLTAKKAIFDAYHKAHPNVTINLVFQNNVVDKSITAVKANNGPDIISWADDSLGRLVGSGTVVPTDQYISSDYINSTYSKAAAEAVTFNGKVYGVPETVEAITLMYNKKLVSAADLPKTTDDMLTFAKTYNQKHPGNYGIVWPTYDPYYNAPWFYGYGAYYVKADGSVGLNTAQGIQAAKFIASFKPYLPKQIDAPVTKALFNDGKAAAVIDGPWSYADYATKSHIDLGFATLPIVTENSNNPATPFVGVKSLWITKNAKNAAACADLLKFYTNTTNQLQMSKQTGEIPANQAAAQDSSVTSNTAIAGYALQASTGVPLPNTPYMSALWKPVQDGLTASWTGNQTPEQAMSAAQAAALKGIQGLQS